jgi:predicted RecB family endonuclease
LTFWKNDRLRRRAEQIVRIVAIVLLALGLVLTYANRVLFDADAFADRAAASLGDPRVASFVGERLADRVIAQKRDLTAVRPALVGAARLVVGSEPFGAVFRQAARSAHAVAFSEGAERVILSLPDFGVLLRGTLSQLRPGLAEQVDVDEDVALTDDIEKVVGSGVLRFLNSASRLREWATLCLGLGALLLAATVGVSRRRRRALLHAGVGLAVAAAALLVLPTLVGGALTARLDDPGLRAAAEGVWDGFTGGLRGWALTLAGIGIVLAAAASSLANHVEVERAVLGAWRWLRSPLERPRAELGRALALLGVGLYVFMDPASALELLAALLGAVLAFEGLRGLFALIAPHMEDTRDRAEEAKGGIAWVRHGAVAVLAAGLIALAIGHLRSPASLPAVPPIVTACNGDPALCDRRLDEVVLPGAHNAMAAADVPGWMFPNHERGIPTQLRNGIRAFLIDVYGGTPVEGRIKTDLSGEAARKKFDKAIGREDVNAAMRIRDRLVGDPQGPRALYLCHGSCEIGAQPLVTVLETMRDFLVENPGEVLLIVIEDYVAPEEIAQAFEESGLVRFVYRGKVEPPWPTLREMITADQRVVVFAEKNSSGVPWYHQAFEVLQETPYHFETPEELSCEVNRGGTDGSLFQINHWIDTTPTPRPSNAEIVNTRQFLLDRARQCQRERGLLPNVFAVDFAATGDIVGAAAELNGLTPREKEPS